MRLILPFLAAVFVAPLPVAALTAASGEDCLADLAAVEHTAARLFAQGANGAPQALVDLLPPGKQPAFEDGFCVIRDIQLPLWGHSTIAPYYFASVLRWQADWADASRPMPPNRLLIEAPRVGISYGGQGDMPDELGQMLRYQAGLITDLYPNEFRLDLAFDPQTDRLEIRQLAAQTAFANRVELSATLRNADLDGVLNGDGTALPPLDKLTLIGIEQAKLTATNNGFFESTAMNWLSLIYPQSGLGDTPEAAVTAAQQLAHDHLAAVPDSLIGPDGKAALGALIDSIPHPLGTLRLHLDAPNGIEPSRIATTLMLVKNPSWDSFGAVIGDAKLSAEWVPAATWPPQPLPSLVAGQAVP